jgi:hypothetical protein
VQPVNPVQEVHPVQPIIPAQPLIIGTSMNKKGRRNIFEEGDTIQDNKKENGCAFKRKQEITTTETTKSFGKVMQKTMMKEHKFQQKGDQLVAITCTISSIQKHQQICVYNAILQNKKNKLRKLVAKHDCRAEGATSIL